MDELFNHEKALRHTMDDEDLLKDLLKFSLEDIPSMLDSLKESLDSGGNEPDDRAVAEWAHKIKGSAGAVSAEKLFTASFELEESAKEKERDRYEALLTFLAETFEEFSADREVRTLAGLAT